MSDFSRRTFLASSACFSIAGCARTNPKTAPLEPDWRNHFSSLKRDGILIDTTKRQLHYWRLNGDEYRAYPCGIAENDDLLKLGRTRVVWKEVDPSWIPTPNMLRRNPKLPRYIAPGPGNPMGSHSLHLTWKYYQIHGTENPAAVGRRTTSGCFRLMNAHVEALYRLVPIGAPVVVI